MSDCVSDAIFSKTISKQLEWLITYTYYQNAAKEDLSRTSRGSQSWKYSNNWCEIISYWKVTARNHIVQVKLNKILKTITPFKNKQNQCHIHDLTLVQKEWRCSITYISIAIYKTRIRRSLLHILIFIAVYRWLYIVQLIAGHD